MVGTVPHKVFKFTNEGTCTRSLRMSFRPEIVHTEQLSYNGWKMYPWASFTVDLGTIEMTLPAGQYRVTVFGSHPEDLLRWESEGGH